MEAVATITRNLVDDDAERDEAQAKLEAARLEAARTELLVLLTPRILRDAKDAHKATDELRERMRAVKPLEHRSQQ